MTPIIRLLPRFRHAYRVLQTLEERERWSRAQIEALQLQRLNRVWGQARQHVPYYRNLAQSRPIPDRFQSLDEFKAAVPLLDKEAVRARPEDFLSDRAGRGSWQRTSGSTGSPMRFFWEKDASLEVLRAKYRFQAQWGLDIFDPMVFLWGSHHRDGAGWGCWFRRFLGRIEDWLRNRLRLCAYHLGHEDIREHLEQIASFRPASLYGFSKATAILAREMALVDFRCDSLRVVILTGEPASVPLRHEVGRQLGARVAVEYGSTECPFIAGTGPDHLFHVREDIALVETLARPDGQYDIVLTVLNNPAFPLLRYVTHDLTSAPLQTPGRGFAALADVIGRDDDLLATRTGRYVHPTLVDVLFEAESRSVVRRFRVHQHRDGSLAALVELNPGVRALDVHSLQDGLSRLVEGFAAEVRIVDLLPTTAAGKHRAVTSDLTASSHRAEGNVGSRQGVDVNQGRGFGGFKSAS
jgi:phenylacetate-CoA ligase